MLTEIFCSEDIYLLQRLHAFQNIIRMEGRKTNNLKRRFELVDRYQQLVQRDESSNDYKIARKSTWYLSCKIPEGLLEFVNEQCCICAEPFQDDPDQDCLVLNTCQHVFHCKCVLNWLYQHNFCPLCRQKLFEQ